MFESAEIGHKISRKDYKAAEPELRAALLDVQRQLLAHRHCAVVVLVNGVDGAGKGETVNLLNEWMDPRHIRTEAFGAMEAARLQGHPPMWRFWQVLPPRGHIGILFGSWYTDPVADHLAGHDKKERFAQRLEQIREFERMLVAEGVLLIKLWFHMTEDGIRRRFKTLEANPRTAWRVKPADWKRLDNHDKHMAVWAHALRKTNTAEAPWLVVDGTDPAYRALTVGRHVLNQIQHRLAGPAPTDHHAAPSPPAPLDGRALLDTLDYSQQVSKADYQDQLALLQGRLDGLLRSPALAHRSVVLVFEGMDAAGKGSTIRRITQAIDARHYRVIPVAAPNESERAQPYLWRFWRYLPNWGHTTVFDRSWYGRVLVERVEGFCAAHDWMRAYDEINAFEEQLSQAGAIVVKFWLAITPEEQLRRFQERQNTPHKAYKITDEDWRNREKWPLYARAVDDMIDRTSTDYAPWHVVASDQKWWSRLTVLQTLCERLEAATSSR